MAQISTFKPPKCAVSVLLFLSKYNEKLLNMLQSSFI